jgi:alpha-glucosidase
MIVAPITSPASRETGLATRTVWIPPGTWIEWFTGTQLQGPATTQRTFALNEIPVYVKAGAIVPSQPRMRNTAEKPVDPLILTVFPGAESGTTRVYDDEGNTPGYTGSAFAWTTVRHSRVTDGSERVEVLPVEGRYPGMRISRAYEIRLPLTLPPDAVSINGAALRAASAPVAGGWHYDGTTLTTVIEVPSMPVDRHVEVLVKFPAVSRTLVDGVPGRLARLRSAMNILNTTWPNGWSPDLLIDASQAGRRMTLRPSTARQELEKLQRDMPALVDAIRSMGVDCGTLTSALVHLGHTATCVPAIK